MKTISVVTIAKNEQLHIESFLKSVAWADEIIVVDNNSTDKTAYLARQFTPHVFTDNQTNLGLLKQDALTKATGDWILLLDVDEIITTQLQQEIKEKIAENKMDAFAIPYANHFLGHHLVCRAQQYSKIRLFRKGHGAVKPDVVHEEVRIKGKLGRIKNPLLHYSFRSIGQVLQKFTHYAALEATVMWEQGQRASVKRLTLYPAHMFYSIFVEDEGYKDKLWGFGLAACFAYYEWLRYYFLLRLQLGLFPFIEKTSPKVRRSR